MYKQFGELEKFYSMLPEINDPQQKILNAYYAARRDADRERNLTSSELENAALFTPYDEDIAVVIMRKLDNYFISLVTDKIKRERAKP